MKVAMTQEEPKKVFRPITLTVSLETSAEALALLAFLGGSHRGSVKASVERSALSAPGLAAIADGTLYAMYEALKGYSE